MVGFRDLDGLFQPNGFYDSILWFYKGDLWAQVCGLKRVNLKGSFHVISSNTRMWHSQMNLAGCKATTNRGSSMHAALFHRVSPCCKRMQMLKIHSSSEKQPNICGRKKYIQIFRYKGTTHGSQSPQVWIVRDKESIWGKFPYLLLDLSSYWTRSAELDGLLDLWSFPFFPSQNTYFWSGRLNSVDAAGPKHIPKHFIY